MSAETVEALLHQARLHRAGGDLDSAARTLAEASTFDVPDELAVRVRWKWSKALADLGHTERSLTVLREAPFPLFQGYTQAHRGARRLARLHQERAGYASPLLLWIWDALLEATRDHGPDATERVLLDRAWCHLCRGDLASMEEDLDEVEQHDAAARYTRLCAANWSLDGSAAARLAPALTADAPHLAVALAEASHRFGLRAPESPHASPYLTALAAGHGFGDLPERLRVEGPEFALAAHQSAMLAGERTAPTELWGCAIFAG